MYYSSSLLLPTLGGSKKIPLRASTKDSEGKAKDLASKAYRKSI